MLKPTENTNTTEDEPLKSKWLEENIKTAAKVLGLTYEPHIDKYVITEIVERYNKEVRRFSRTRPEKENYGPNTFKRAGYLAFWIRKLKPLRCGDHGHRYANESLAYFAGQALIDSNYPGDITASVRVAKKGKRLTVAKFQEEI